MTPELLRLVNLPPRAWPKARHFRPNFFTIAGFPHYENVLSNVYAYFFRSQQEHDLGTLAVAALLDTAREATQRAGRALPAALQGIHSVLVQREFRIRREGQTDLRLDLLLHDGHDDDDVTDATYAILIENKVYHTLSNDLQEYWEKVAVPADRKLGLVMGVRPTESMQNAHWLYIRHLDFALALERRLGAALGSANPRAVTLLAETIQNIKQMTNEDTELQPTLAFYLQHRAAIKQAVELQALLYEQLGEALIPVLQSLNLNPNFPNDGRKEGWIDGRTDSQQEIRYSIWYDPVFSAPRGEDACFWVTLITRNSFRAAAWRDQLLSNPQVSAAGIGAAPRGGVHLIARSYKLSSQNPEDFKHLVRQVIERDWLPLEPIWRAFPL